MARRKRGVLTDISAILESHPMTDEPIDLGIPTETITISGRWDNGASFSFKCGLCGNPFAPSTNEGLVNTASIKELGITMPVCERCVLSVP